MEATCLLPYEVLNALRFADVFTREELRRVADGMDRFGISLHLLQGALSEATLEIATSRDLTVYDASYVALARRLESPFYSVDDDLMRAVQSEVEAVHVREYRTPGE